MFEIEFVSSYLTAWPADIYENEYYVVVWTHRLQSVLSNSYDLMHMCYN